MPRATARTSSATRDANSEPPSCPQRLGLPGRAPPGQHAVQHRRVEDRQPPRPRVDEATRSAEGAVPQSLRRHQRRAPHILGSVDVGDATADRMPRSADALVVAVEVHLVAGRVRAAMRPPLRIARLAQRREVRSCHLERQASEKRRNLQRRFPQCTYQGISNFELSATRCYRRCRRLLRQLFNLERIWGCPIRTNTLACNIGSTWCIIVNGAANGCE